MKTIDMRSDTITKPTEGMRKAIYEAEVGDDVFGEDPTVNRLQEVVAEMLGKERALYVCSGTMGNLLSVKANTNPGDEVILDSQSHIFYYEAAGAAAICGVQLNLVDGNRGAITREQVEAKIRQRGNPHFPITSLVCIENTHNRWSGAVIPIDEIRRIRELADEKGIRMHMDGARLLNAQVASGIPAKEYSKYFDTVTVCFSKGLGAPMGSIIAGDTETMDRVHRARKMVGGGQRQVGIAAAAALYALENNVDRLKDDHDNAKRMAVALSDMPGVNIDPDEVETNIVYFDVTQSPMKAIEVVIEMSKLGVLMLPLDENRVRAVTHLGIDNGDIDMAIEAFSEVFK
ncbi:MAG: aminotransferase class I/II-fold pyridoxal phosphate-dependent enzyme [Deltaproteobacteria bacterium]|uniref:Aminotransferase class I/II-fold pyridoxal phosphate-dependent enzyme n=1 Tax=Candidatus Zymogenus saltonus TaxID=2844893 RepID=A0A9D8KCI7_9DELT|nr:aminotransferase class I/II-fold pyridoxal phosphate-dependent enzyme [Candidatus Zymogenus saltonus]